MIQQFSGPPSLIVLASEAASVVVSLVEGQPSTALPHKTMFE
jgi:hypothetical protein